MFLWKSFAKFYRWHLRVWVKGQDMIRCLGLEQTWWKSIIQNRTSIDHCSHLNESRKKALLIARANHSLCFPHLYIEVANDWWSTYGRPRVINRGLWHNRLDWKFISNSKKCFKKYKTTQCVRFLIYFSLSEKWAKNTPTQGNTWKRRTSP